MSHVRVSLAADKGNSIEIVLDGRVFLPGKPTDGVLGEPRVYTVQVAAAAILTGKTGLFVLRPCDFRAVHDDGRVDTDVVVLGICPTVFAHGSAQTIVSLPVSAFRVQRNTVRVRDPFP